MANVIAVCPSRRDGVQRLVISKLVRARSAHGDRLALRLRQSVTTVTADWDPAKLGGKNHLLLEALKVIGLERFDVLFVYDDDIKFSIYHHLLYIRQEFKRFPRLGVLSGERRFVNHSTIASATRVTWQNFANIVMPVGDICWGGHMAIRRDLVQVFAAEWRRSLFDDVIASRICKTHGFEFRYDAKFFAEDHSDISWADLFGFVTRQLIDVRLYGNWWAVWFSWLFLLFVTLSLLTTYPLIGIPLYLIASHKLTDVCCVLATPAAQVLHLVTVPLAQFKRRIIWRGVRYELRNFLHKKIK